MLSIPKDYDNTIAYYDTLFNAFLDAFGEKIS